MTPEQIAELEALVAMATPGPWGIYAQTIAASTPERKADNAKAEMLLQVEMTTEMVDHIYLLWAGDKCPATTGCGPTSAANAALIIALRNNLPAILAALKAQQPDEAMVERVAELQLASFLAGRGSVKFMQYGTRSAAHAPSMDEFRSMAIAAMQESRDE